VNTERVSGFEGAPAATRSVHDMVRREQECSATARNKR
jgi:hypothetical protein